jgi:glutamate-1-semialdehyde 2,1-aminomutase
MFSVFFVEEDVSVVPNFEVASAQRTDRFKAFFHAMLERGVYLPPSAFEAWFLTAAHDSKAIDRIVSALPDAARAALATPVPEGVR